MAPESSEERKTPEQRAFSADEVAIMLGVSPATVSSLLAEGKLGSRKIGDFRRVFLSDLEDYLGKRRARSLVCEINSGADDAGGNTSRSSTPESNAPNRGDSTDNGFDMEARTGGEYSRKDRSRKNRMSQYEPVVQKWSEIDKDNEAIVLADLSKDDVQNIRTLLYRRVGKENVIVRTAEQQDGTFKAVVRAREGNNYLKE